MPLSQEVIRFLHITDPHFAAIGSPLGDQDIKSPLVGTSPRTKEDALEWTLAELDKFDDCRKISAIFLTGDCDFRGASGGMVRLREILQSTLGKSSMPPIVVVPGNHDVAQGSDPSSQERYKTFLDSWRVPDLNTITPFLDGIDRIEDLDTTWDKHCLASAALHQQFIAIPINSCNWSQSKLASRKDYDHKFWGDLAALSVSKNKVNQKAFEEKLQKQLAAFSAVDAALISDTQFNALKKIINLAEKKVGDGAIKIALIHHHLLPVNSREEHKIYGDLINLELLRQFLRSHGFHILIHGHKHANAVYVDHIYQEARNDFDAHEVLVISGGTLNSDRQAACRLIDLESISNAPLCKIKTLSLITAGENLSGEHIQELAERSLWKLGVKKTPTIISGKGINEVYARVCQLFQGEKLIDRPVICHIEFAKSEYDRAISPPMGYPTQLNDANGKVHNLEQWFHDTVEWWQLKYSKSEARIPYIHGTRLYRFGGAVDQIGRIVRLLKRSPTTSKAVAVLVDPIRDFCTDSETRLERFASFCLVQFKLHNDVLECIAYYRAQEFRKWWPVNVAELRKLQIAVGRQLGASVSVGSITTITGDARFEDNGSPTQVAVSLIDQWLDNCPEKIAAIAHAVLWPGHAGGKDSKYLEDWQRCFSDILASTEVYTSEGIPIALEGLSQLSSFLTEFSDAESADHKILISSVQSLLDANGQFSLGEKNEGTFKLWSNQVKRHVKAILKWPNEFAKKKLN